MEVVFRDQDGAYDISVGTTIAENRMCTAPIEAALATILGLTPEQVVLTVKAVSQDEVEHPPTITPREIVKNGSRRRKRSPSA